MIIFHKHLFILIKKNIGNGILFNSELEFSAKLLIIIAINAKSINSL